MVFNRRNRINKCILLLLIFFSLSYLSSCKDNDTTPSREEQWLNNYDRESECNAYLNYINSKWNSNYTINGSWYRYYYLCEEVDNVNNITTIKNDYLKGFFTFEEKSFAASMSKCYYEQINMIVEESNQTIGSRKLEFDGNLFLDVTSTNEETTKIEKTDSLESINITLPFCSDIFHPELFYTYLTTFNEESTDVKYETIHFNYSETYEYNFVRIIKCYYSEEYDVRKVISDYYLDEFGNIERVLEFENIVYSASGVSKCINISRVFEKVDEYSISISEKDILYKKGTKIDITKLVIDLD